MKRILFHRLVGVLVAVISAGWLLPLGLGIDAYLQYWRGEALPQLLSQPQPNSFPYLHFATQCLHLSFLWLALVLGGWSYAAYSFFVHSAKD